MAFRYLDWLLTKNVPSGGFRLLYAITQCLNEVNQFTASSGLRRPRRASSARHRPSGRCCRSWKGSALSKSSGAARAADTRTHIGCCRDIFEVLFWTGQRAAGQVRYGAEKTPAGRCFKTPAGRSFRPA